MDMSKYRALFVTESREHLEGISKALLTLEKTPADRPALDALFRHAHSIKGMAASMGYDPVATMAHKLEDLADMARRGVPFDAEAVELWLEGGDWLGDAVSLVEGGREADLALPTLMQRILGKAAQMTAAAPGAGSTTFPNLAAVRAPSGTTQPSLPVTAAAGTTDARLPAVAAAPSATPTGSLPAVGPQATVMLPAVGAGPGGTQPTLTLSAVGPREFDVEVRISESAATPHVRAFLVHKRVTEKLEVVQMTPPLADLKRGTLPERRLRMRVRGTLDAVSIQSMIKALTDVADCLVTDTEKPAPAAATAPGPRPAPADLAARTVRVRTELLDELIDSVGEILLARARLHALSIRLDDPDLGDLADEFNRFAQGLHERVMSARMHPVSLLTDRLPRVVRDLAKKRGREVDFTVEGTNIELDRAMLDELHDVVLHLVRNAVDHAHEGGEARVAAGKPATMHLTLAASRDRDHVLIELHDDGQGMDPERLRASAIDKGVITAEAARLLSDQQALELICRPGFSTAQEVSDTSGRGVGMDVVLSTVEHLGGQLLIQSVVGKGTSFTLRLPLTVAIIRVLLVSAGPTDAVYALPLHRVESALDFQPAELLHSHGETLYPLGDEIAPVHDLGPLLGHAVEPWPASGTVVVIETPFRPLGVRVDRILGQQEVVVKPLGMPLSQVPYLSGAAVLADGRPAYILDVAKLIAVTPQSAHREVA
ncbi:MAG: chemotaxis protein CheA [Deltaproteobacteria bacterium]|nr:chemotaxis protein CheA [Deltaproteobacteria bacterium]